ncbi:sensor histidine kinase [Planomonospora sp. ID91781]|uniref:ATP-binding protein n=1 Tax=Planomonospora sp. ID91781 TaxID=2738135 RepID=UPI0018C35B42|nr:ATP-binding protein [Planomonospora sp. ID91781]MBG0825683.1 sensor histidine kinase [Planomonospora sp. ID91781]
MPHPLLEVLLALCLVAAVAVAVRQWRMAAALHRQHAALVGELRARDEEARHLVEVRLPALAESLFQPSVPVPGPLHAHLATTGYGHSMQAAMGQLDHHVRAALARADQAARATLQATMRGLQGLTSEQRRAISDMQTRYDHPGILDALLGIDHMNAQISRRAQAVAVLCGAWPGQQRGDVALEDVVRGAISRVRDFLRVQTAAQTDQLVVGRVVEPVVLAVAELLDNATRHSPPTTAVEVSIKWVHNGAAIVIDDGGIGMHEQDKQKATEILSGAQPVDVTRLGDPPKIGFPVIGALARRYGFQVTVDSQSPYGGVRAVILLPTALLAHPSAQDAPTLPPPSVPAPAQAPPAGLYPQRRRRAADPALQQPQPAAADAPPRSPEQAAAVAAAFQQAPRAARTTPSPDREGNPPS